MPIVSDADLGNNSDQEAQVAESCASRETRFQNDEAHLHPSRWWFLSTAFPMIAGSLGPVASAFSICALVQPWRQHLVPQGDVQEAPFVANPSWLTIVNAIQLALALISNMFLLLNMARRVRFSLAQPITIIGWYTSAICRVSLCATASGPLRRGIKFPESELIWSQAFYYSIWAAILYFLDASLLATTLWGAITNHYEKDFILTSSQRTLMLHTILFLLYVLIGACIFSNIEDWNYLDAVYWADVTLFTIGFGDYCPKTALGRALLIPYALIGITSLGLVIGSVMSLILEHGRRCITVRMEEKKRRKIVWTMIRRSDDILEPIREESEISRAQSGNAPATEFERRKAEFALMREIQARSSFRRKWMAIAISIILWLVLWLVGAVIFEKAEKPYQGWSYFDAFYFCFEAWTTIGYGDLTPISNAGKSFFVFWSVLALPTMTALVTYASDTVVKLIQDGTLRLGNVTILPNEEGFVNNMKYIISNLTFGHVFPGYLDSASPEVAESMKSTDRRLTEIMTQSNEQTVQGDDSSRYRAFTQSCSAPQGTQAASTLTSRVRTSLSRPSNSQDELPTGPDFHLLLISEIQVVANHLKESKPHRYTFDEWAWYLKLMGEDEHKARTHCKAKPTADDGDSDEKLTWSWIGSRSPLLGRQEESEWIHRGLMERLRVSLCAERRRQLRSGDIYNIGTNSQ